MKKMNINARLTERAKARVKALHEFGKKNGFTNTFVYITFCSPARPADYDNTEEMKKVAELTKDCQGDDLKICKVLRDNSIHFFYLQGTAYEDGLPDGSWLCTTTDSIELLVHREYVLNEINGKEIDIEEDERKIILKNIK